MKYKQNYRYRRAMGQLLFLQELLTTNVPCSATDTWDKIFLLLGLAPDVADADELIPEYSEKISVE